MSLLRAFSSCGWRPGRRTRSEAPVKKRSMIPRNMHFVWGLLGGSRSLPERYERYYKQWIAANVGWHVYLQDRKCIDRVVSTYDCYPYDEYSKDIQRCDACRPMLLHQVGGVYSDLDVEPLRPLDELFSLYPHANVLLVVETEISKCHAQQIGREEPIRCGVPELPLRVANYFMASIPGHPFWLEVLELMKQRCQLPVCSDYDVLYTTGPDVMTEVAHRAVKCYLDVALVPKDVIDQFITHQCTGSWRGV